MKTRVFEISGGHDQIFAKTPFPKRFTFDHEVAEVFDDMVQRSIPLYEETLYYTACYAQKFYAKDTRVYDIGCSTGSAMYAIAAISPERMHLVGIDQSSAMLAKAKKKLKDFERRHDIELVPGSAQSTNLNPASVVVLNYTLQFIPVQQRRSLLSRIYAALLPGGVLILSEKLRFGSPVFQETMTELYEDFKLENGYSRTEIERKKESLDEVLIPYSREEQLKLLNEVGFSDVCSVMQWHNFATFLAIKN